MINPYKVNPYKVVAEEQAHVLEKSNISRKGLCARLARAEIQKQLLTELIRSATIEWYPEKFNGLMNKIHEN